MTDMENVVKAIDICLGHGVCNDCPYCFSGKGYATMNCRDYMLRDVLALLKEQDETIKELQSAYDYLQKQFFEVQDKLLTQDSVEHACEILRANGWKETEPICSECNAVHVVLCKDCKYCHHVINTVNGEVRLYRVICVKPYGQGSAVHEPDWFCADGERKDS